MLEGMFQFEAAPPPRMASFLGPCSQLTPCTHAQPTTAARLTSASCGAQRRHRPTPRTTVTRMARMRPTSSVGHPAAVPYRVRPPAAPAPRAPLLRALSQGGFARRRRPRRACVRHLQAPPPDEPRRATRQLGRRWRPPCAVAAPTAARRPRPRTRRSTRSRAAWLLRHTRGTAPRGCSSLRPPALWHATQRWGPHQTGMSLLLLAVAYSAVPHHNAGMHRHGGDRSRPSSIATSRHIYSAVSRHPTGAQCTALRPPSPSRVLPGGSPVETGDGGASDYFSHAHPHLHAHTSTQVAALRQEVEEKALAECTFTPRTGRPPSPARRSQGAVPVHERLHAAKPSWLDQRSDALRSRQVGPGGRKRKGGR